MQLSHQSDRATITFQRQLTHSDREDFYLIIGELVERTPANLALDASELHFIDSAGLGFFLMLHSRLQHSRCNIVVRGLQGQPRQVMHLTQLDRQFTVEAASVAA